MIRKLQIGIGLLLVGSILYFVVGNPFRAASDSSVKIGTSTFKVEVAKTVEEQAAGLSNRQSLADDSGMLFVFDEKQSKPFWMKDMRFPIDIIWIADNRVVDITASVPIPTSSSINDLQMYSPMLPVDHVLEVNAGITKAQNIGIGQLVNYNLVD